MQLTRSEVLRINAVGAETGVKYCTSCESLKSLDSFLKSESRSTCKECLNKRAVERRRERKSGWTPEAFQEATERQNGVCANAYCMNDIQDADHCHETGKPRGLLCRRCNLILGNTGDSVEVLAGLIAYLQLHND